MKAPSDGPARRAFLVGLSGSGKSTVARRAARLLGWTLCDTDRMIVDRAGIPIDEIFANFGEAEFRRMEREALLEALRVDGAVVATGGGMILDERNRRDMAQSGLVFYIKTSPENCARHLRKSKRAEARPLLQGSPSPEDRLRTLLAERAKHYEAAHIVLDGDSRDQNQLAGDVVQALTGAADAKTSAAG